MVFGEGGGECLFYPYEYHMNLCHESCSSGLPAEQPAVCLGVAETLALDITGKLFNQIVIPTIDFYHLMPLSMTLTVPGSHKVSAEQNLLASFCHTFQLIRIEFDMVMKQFKLKIVILVLSEIS